MTMLNVPKSSSGGSLVRSSPRSLPQSAMAGEPSAVATADREPVTPPGAVKVPVSIPFEQRAREGPARARHVQRAAIERAGDGDGCIPPPRLTVPVALTGAPLE